MRWLTVLLLCGLLAPVAGAGVRSPQALAMQATPPPPSTASIGFCPDEQLWRGFTAEEQHSLSIFTNEPAPADAASAVFNPISASVGVVPAVDVEQPDGMPRFSGDLALVFLTLPAGSCRFQSLFYPAAIITVTAGTIEMFVEPGPGGLAGTPAPAGTIWRSDTGVEDLTLPGPITIKVDEWVTLRNRASVGFRNSGTSEATLAVAANHPPAVVYPTGVFVRGCVSGCSGRRP